MTRTQIQNSIAATIKTETGYSVEVTVSSSIARGNFVSLCGSVEALDAARSLMSGAATFSDRDIDPDDTVQIDFYSM